MTLKIRESATPLSEKQLAAAERTMGVQFAADYRAFLLKHNGGQPKPGNMLFKREGKTHRYEIETFFAIGAGSETEDLQWNFNCYKGSEPRLPQRMLPIAGDGFGNLFCLSLSSADQGKIYFWEHDGEDATDSRLVLVADSFGELLAGLGQNLVDAASSNPEAWGDPDVARQFVEASANVNLAFADGRTPLHVAAYEGSADAVRLLLASGARVRVWDHRDCTALHYAIRSRNFETIKLLLDAGEDLHAKAEGGPPQPAEPAMTQDMLRRSSIARKFMGNQPLGPEDLEGLPPERLEQISQLQKLARERDTNNSDAAGEFTKRLGEFIRGDMSFTDFRKQVHAAAQQLVVRKVQSAAEVLEALFDEELKDKVNAYAAQRRQTARPDHSS